MARPSSAGADGEGTILSAPGRLVISFDFELFWGVRDSTTLERYGPNILGVREAIPRLLERFERHGIRATWGTVGFLFFDDRDELLAHLPEIRPQYADRRLSPYEALFEVGPDEKRDPYHFGLSLIRRIQACPGQEIGTHTFSHYYCLEAGQDAAAFRADLLAAGRAAARIGVGLESITFPRHQINDGYLATCRELGLIAYRGQPRSWLHDPYGRRMPLRRALRLADAYVGISGDNGGRARRGPGGMIDVPASRFLRPYAARLATLEGLRLRRLRGEMRRAAQRGAIYHLWWHPHNFGRNLDENFAVLDRLLATFRELALEHGMQASTMAEIAAPLAIEAQEAAGDAPAGAARRGAPRAAAAPDRAGG